MNLFKYSLLILLLPILASSQNKSSLNIVFSPDYNYRSLTGPDSLQWSIDIFNESNKAKLNFRFGMDYSHQIGQSNFLKTGIRYARIGFFSLKEELFLPDMTVSYGEISNNSHFIEIPIVIRKEFGGNRIAPFLELGVSPMLYINSLQITTIDGNRETVAFHRNDSAQTDYNNLQFSLNLSTGFNVLLKEQYQLFFSPTFRYHLTKTANAINTQHLFNLGIEVGIRKFLTTTTKEN